MKKIFSLGILLPALLTMFLSSCSSNDNDGPDEGTEIPTLPEVKYASEAAKYVVSNGSDIKSIELTVDGQYIVVPSQVGAYSVSEAKGRIASLFPVKPIAQSRSLDSIVTGKFVKISDTEYILEGYGTIVIEGSSSTAVSITVTPMNGNPTTVSAQKASQMPDSEITKAVSRTWKIDRLGISLKINGRQLYNQTKPASQINDLMNEGEQALADFFNSLSDDPDDWYEPEVYDFQAFPSTLILSRSGTYLSVWSDATLGLAVWHWKDESKYLFHFSWDYENQETSALGVGDDATISFNGTTMIVTEPRTIVEDGTTLETVTKYYLSVIQ